MVNEVLMLNPLRFYFKLLNKLKVKHELKFIKHYTIIARSKMLSKEGPILGVFPVGNA